MEDPDACIRVFLSLNFMELWRRGVGRGYG
jgi:hypothetical protein